MKPVWLLDNPDVPTCHAALGVRSLSSRFGTAPLFWNYLFGAMKAVPKSLLQNQDAMQVWITERITKTNTREKKGRMRDAEERYEGELRDHGLSLYNVYVYNIVYSYSYCMYICIDLKRCGGEI